MAKKINHAADGRRYDEIAGGYFKVLHMFFDQRLAGLVRPGAWLVYTALAHLANRQGNDVKMTSTLGILEDITSLSRKTVRLSLAELVEKRLIRQLRMGGRQDGQNVPGVYELVLPNDPDWPGRGHQAHPGVGEKVTHPGGEERAASGVKKRQPRGVKRNPKQEELKKNNKGVVENLEVADRLRAQGVEPDQAVRFATELNHDYVADVLASIEMKTGIDDRAAYLSSWLQRRWPVSPAVQKERRRREKESARSEQLNRETADRAADRRRTQMVDSTLNGWFESAPPHRAEDLFDQFLETLPTRQRATAERKRGNPQDCVPFRSFLAERLQLV